MTKTENIIERGQQTVMNTYGRFPYVFEKGDGVYLYDKEGKKYLDFVAGIAVNSLGYGNPRLLRRLQEQMERCMHTSNLYWIEAQVALAERLTEKSCFDKVFFCNSGTEAVESSLKLARKYGDLTSNGERYEIITMENSFHGRTFGSITATGQQKYQKGLGPLLPGIRYAKYNDFDSVLEQVHDHTCAILLEPVQGEGGLIPATSEFMQKIRALCDERDMLMMVDEVQTGIGRCGTLFAHEQFGIEPDVCALAKGLGGGFPIGAMLAKDKAAAAFHPGDHASTFGGNPMASTAGLAVLEEIEAQNLTENARTVGAYLHGQAETLAAKYPAHIKGVRGLGLMQGIVLNNPDELLTIRLEAGKRGLLIISAGHDVLRMVPPLIIETKHIDEAMSILDEAFAALG